MEINGVKNLALAKVEFAGAVAPLSTLAQQGQQRQQRLLDNFFISAAPLPDPYMRLFAVVLSLVASPMPEQRARALRAMHCC